MDRNDNILCVDGPLLLEHRPQTGKELALVLPNLTSLRHDNMVLFFSGMTRNTIAHYHFRSALPLASSSSAVRAL